jgi:hypothetical protein
MQDHLERNFEYCSTCGTHYIDVIGETCRCPSHEADDEINDEMIVST